jgi:hypothetical protein
MDTERAGSSARNVVRGPNPRITTRPTLRRVLDVNTEKSGYHDHNNNHANEIEDHGFSPIESGGRKFYHRRR